MKFLETFSERYPTEDDVKFWEDYLDQNYTKFSNTEFGKMIQIDDKSYFLRNKREVTDRLFWDIKYSFNQQIYQPSLRRAIKNWIDRNNI